MYLVIIPKKAPTHIQKMLPAPPSASAAPTPMMFPTPIVPPSAVLTAANGETPSLFLGENREPTVYFRTVGRRVRGKNPVNRVKYSPHSRVSRMVPLPQSNAVAKSKHRWSIVSSSKTNFDTGYAPFAPNMSRKWFGLLGAAAV